MCLYCKERIDAGLFALFDLGYYCGNNASVVADNTVIGDSKDGCVGIVVDADDAAAVLHADLILHGAGDADIDNVIGLDGSAGLTDLLLMRQPSHVHRGTRGRYLTAKKSRQFAECTEVSLRLYAASAADNKLGLIYSSAGAVFLLGGDDLIAVLTIYNNALCDNTTGPGSIGLQRGEHHGTHGCHLRTLLKDDDMGKYLSAVCGCSLIKHAVLIVAKVYRVCGKAGLEGDHHARCKITAESSGTVENDGGVVLLRKLCESLLIGTCAVGCKVFMLCHDDLICAVGNERIGKRGNAVAEKYRGYILTIVRLEFLRLGQKLKRHRVESPVALLCKYPDAFVVFFSHFNASSQYVLAFEHVDKLHRDFVGSAVKVYGAECALFRLEYLLRGRGGAFHAGHGYIGVKLGSIPDVTGLFQAFHNVFRGGITRSVYPVAHGDNCGQLCAHMLHGVFQHTVAHDPAILNGETGGKRDLRQAKESRSRGAGLRCVAVNGVLAEQQQVIVAYLLRRLCKRVRGRKSVSAAERAVRQQVRLIAAECERLFQHVLSLGRTHGDRSDGTAKFSLQLQCALYGICVKGVEDIMQDGRWIQAKTEEFGSYLAFDVAGTEADIAAVSVISVWWIWAAIAAVALTVILLVVFSIKRRRREHSKTAEKKTKTPAVRAESVPKPDKKRRKNPAAVIITLLLICALGAAAAIFVPQLVVKLAPYKALMEFGRADELSMSVSVEAALGDERISTVVPVAVKRSGENSITCAVVENVPLYYSNAMLILENGKSYSISSMFPDYSSLLGEITALYRDVEYTGDGSACMVSISGAQAAELLQTLCPALSGETETVNSAAVETVIENGSVQSITVSASGESSGSAFEVCAVISGMETSSDAVIPEAVAEAAAQNSAENLPEISGDLFRIISAWAELDGRDSIAAKLKMAVNCGPVVLDTTLDVDSAVANGKRIYCVGKNNLKLYTDGSSMVNASGAGVTDEEAQLAGNVNLLNVVYQACLNGNISAAQTADGYTYTVALDGDGVKQLVEIISPDAAKLNPNLAYGDIKLYIGAGRITGISVSCTGTVQVVVVEAPVSVSADVSFEERSTARFPSAVTDKLSPA